LRFQGWCSRGHDPQWSFSPLSGESARHKGGRFNPIGTPALYLGLSPEVAWAEASHGFAHRFEPLTLCAYEVDVDDVVDLRTEDDSRSIGVDPADLACAWEYDLSNGTDPASWAVARRFIHEGAAGILVPSFARGARPDMHNLVVWKWGPDLPHRVTVYDPSDRLPKNQLSWETAKTA